jgi:transcriptional regulator with XRE-family HTH domain
MEERKMLPARENTAHGVQKNGSVAERLRAFMRAHDLSLEELAIVLRTPPQTLAHWFDDGMAPPACLLALMVLLETLPRAKAFGSVEEIEADCSRQEEGLRRVRAI